MEKLRKHTTIILLNKIATAWTTLDLLDAERVGPLAELLLGLVEDVAAGAGGMRGHGATGAELVPAGGAGQRVSVEGSDAEQRRAGGLRTPSRRGVQLDHGQQRKVQVLLKGLWQHQRLDLRLRQHSSTVGSRARESIQL